MFMLAISKILRGSSFSFVGLTFVMHGRYHRYLGYQTNKRRLAGVVDVQQVTVQVQVLVTPELDGSIRRAVGQSTRGKGDLGV
jgi:purine nucleoside phosphorylase